jgi:phosphate-selective porin OprO/OprP
MAVFARFGRLQTFATLALALITLVVPPLPAQQTSPHSSASDVGNRIAELEAVVRQLQMERTRSGESHGAPAADDDGVIGAKAPAAIQCRTQTVAVEATGPPAAVAPPSDISERGQSETHFLAGWDDRKGFILHSADDRFNLRFTGQIQGDYRAFLDARDYTDLDTFLVRRARLGIEADMFKYFEFRLLPDFSNNQAPGVNASARIQDAYINIHYWHAFQVEAGKFKQPFSYEQLIQDRFVPTVERSLIDQLVPSRDEGIMIHGQNLFRDHFDYAISVSNGEINGDNDTGKNKDLVARLAVRPFDEDFFWEFLHGLQLGIAGTTGEENEPVSPNVLRTPATVLFFQFNSSVRADGLRNRWSPEVTYFNGSLGFAAQYFHQQQDLQPVFAGPGSQYHLDIPFDGFYVMGTYLLTGERRTTFSAPIAPLRPFDPCHAWCCCGAWELVGRISRLTVGEDVFARLPTGRTTFVTLADPAKFSRGATELTAGFNWYLNRWVRMQFNYEHAWFDDAVRLGPGPQGLLRHQDSLLARLQLIF